MAKLYDEATTTYQGNDGLNLINKLTLTKGSHVLDLGCGTGYLTSVLAERVGPNGNVVGVDPDGQRVMFAQEKYGKSCSHLHFLKGSCDDFPEGPYNIVFCSHVLHWIENIERAFENVYRSLFRGGCFALVCVEEVPPILVEIQGADVQGCIYNWSSGDIEKAACKSGFEVGFKSIDPTRYTFTTVDALVVTSIIK